MQIEITPKIAAWLEVALNKDGAMSASSAIELLIDAVIDSETGLPVPELRHSIKEGLESGTLDGDAKQAVADIFAQARARHGI